MKHYARNIPRETGLRIIENRSDDRDVTRNWTGEPERESEVATFLRNMHALNISIVHQLSPILEEQQGIDLRLYFMLHIIEGGKVHPSAIAQAMHLPNSLVTKHLDQLGEKGFLARSLDPDDSRRVRVALTTEGIRVIHESDATLATLVGERLSAHSTHDSQRSDAFLATLVALAQE